MLTTTLRGSLGDQWDNATDMTRVARVQVQLNRYAANHAPRWPLISAITGGVGPQTIALFTRVKNEGLLPGLANIAPTRDGISTAADNISGWLVGYGNDHGWPGAAPATVVTPEPPTPKPSSGGGGGGGTVLPAPPPFTIATASPPPYFTYAAVALGGLAVLYGAFRLSKGVSAGKWGEHRMATSAATMAGPWVAQQDAETAKIEKEFRALSRKQRDYLHEFSVHPRGKAAEKLWDSMTDAQRRGCRRMIES